MDLSRFIPVFQEEVLEQKLNVKMVASSYLEGDCLVGVEVDMCIPICCKVQVLEDSISRVISSFDFTFCVACWAFACATCT